MACWQKMQGSCRRDISITKDESRKRERRPDAVYETMLAK